MKANVTENPSLKHQICSKQHMRTVFNRFLLPLSLLTLRLSYHATKLTLIICLHLIQGFMIYYKVQKKWYYISVGNSPRRDDK